MTTINKQVSFGTDDCMEYDKDEIWGGINLTNSTIAIGYTGEVDDGGFRWQSVNIPKGATINSAKLSLFINTGGDYGTLSANIRGIDEDNTATWSDGSRPSDRTKTTATITANEANWSNWAEASWVDIDISSVIQEIVNRSGWSANNALAIVIEDTSGTGTNYSIVRAYEFTGNAHGAKLDVDFSEAASTRSTMNVHPGVLFQTLTGGQGY